MGGHRGRGLVALVALSLAGCSPCHTQYVLDWKCGGTIMAPSSLLLPDALAPDCRSADATCFSLVNDGCLPMTGRCTDACLANSGSPYLATPAVLALAIKIKLPAAGAPMLSVTLPDPSVTVVATYHLDGTSDPSVPFNAVGGALTLKITANDLTSTFSLRLMDAAGQEIDIENGSYTGHGHDQAICLSD